MKLVALFVALWFTFSAWDFVLMFIGLPHQLQPVANVLGAGIITYLWNLNGDPD